MRHTSFFVLHTKGYFKGDLFLCFIFRLFCADYVDRFFFVDFVDGFGCFGETFFVAVIWLIVQARVLIRATGTATAATEAFLGKWPQFNCC